MSDVDNIRNVEERAVDEENFIPQPYPQSTPSPPKSPQPETATRPPTKAYSPFSLPVLALLAPSSIFGVLARLGVESLTKYDGNTVFPLAWVQGLGCLVMGIAVGLREPLTIFYPPLYTAITTGFCGSFTTFSSWNLRVFLALSNASGYHRVWLYDVIDGLTQILVTLAVSIGALKLGLHIATLAAPRVPLKLSTPRLSIRYAVTFISLASYIITIPLYFVLSPSYRSDVTAALLFGYPGALTRHTFSILLNPINPSFPLGTYTANIFATFLIAAFHTLQHHQDPVRLIENTGLSKIYISTAACAILQGLQDGFCGCLSTVSTFAVEIRGLKARAWLYGGGSILSAQLALILIVGVPWWSGAVKERNVCSFPT